MQQEPFAETIQDSPELIRLERGQYSMLLHSQMSTDGSIYFSLPDQDGDLYEYEGDLDEALDDLPGIYSVIAVENELQQSPTLTPEAAIVVEQLWNYFDQAGTQELEGEQDYNFRIENGWLLVLPKEPSEEVVAISRDGEVQSSFEPERYEHLMERCAIAYSKSVDQMQVISLQEDNDQSWERG
jgi:hypothetical protein